MVQKKQMPLPKETLFGLGLGAALLIGGAAWVKQMLFPPIEPPCSTNYALSLSFPKQESGQPEITLRDLQSSLGFDEAGLVEHVSLIKEKQGSDLLTLEVKLPEGSLDPRSDTAKKGGVAFSWAPGIPKTTAAACIAYDVFFPKDFDFNQGGVLPGVYGGSDIATNGAYGASLGWGREGALAVVAKMPDANGELKAATIGVPQERVPRGKWVRLEQEIVLNRPGAKGGFVKVWLDGKPVLARGGLGFVQPGQTGLTGAEFAVHYQRAAAPAETSIHISPIDLRWR